MLGLAQAGSSSGALSSEQSGHVRRLDYDGEPMKGNPRIAPVGVHCGFIHVSRQGANDKGPAESLEIDTHVRAHSRPDAATRCTNFVIAASVFSGLSRCGECPHSCKTRVSAPGRRFMIASTCASVPYSSCSP
jgi:hypothetical protein